ncbi:MAG TPA: hypothetical protein VGC71_14670 [Gaiellales bacterium]|jgi:hypothetical protein
MDSPQDLGKLARRDVAVFVAGTLVAAAAIAVFALSRGGLGASQHAGALAVVLAALPLSLACIAWWSAGPAKLLRSRLLVVVPVFLIAGPAVGGLLVLGATVAGACFVAGGTVVVGLCFGVLLSRTRA